MIGIKKAVSRKGVTEELEFVDTSSRILRTNRCYLSADGQRVHKTASGLTLDAIDKEIDEEVNDVRNKALRAEKIAAMRQYMTEEYVAETGSEKACSGEVFARLVAKSIVRRLLQACGLTTMMKYSLDGDEILLTVKADERDLAVQSDRCAVYACVVLSHSSLLSLCSMRAHTHACAALNSHAPCSHVNLRVQVKLPATNMQPAVHGRAQGPKNEAPVRAGSFRANAGACR